MHTLSFQSLCIVSMLTLASCAPSPPATPPTAAPLTVPKISQPFAKAPPTPAPEISRQPTGPKHSLKAQNVSANGITLTIVTFDRRDHELVVVDQPGGPGSKYDRAEEAAQGHLAAINAGFFTPEGTPLGLVATSGERRGAINRASFLGTGFFLGPAAELMSRPDFLASSPGNREILQSGPRLVWAGETLTGLSDQDERPRSFLLWDGRDHFALGYTDSATLAGLSKILLRQPIPNFNIAYGLNLDGGRSCDFWVSPAVSGGGFTRSSFFNKDVRNFLVLKRKP